MLLNPIRECSTPKAVCPHQHAASIILAEAGEDVRREGLLRTPERFAKAMKAITEGYHMTLDEVVGQGVFEAEGRGLVSVKDIEFYSMCEHHMLPFWGKVSVSYYPSEKIIGLSKVPRIVELFSRRFQVQERITQQVAQAIQQALDPRAVFVRVQAAHLCMMMRGIEKQHSSTVTETMIGVDNLSADEKSRLFSSI
jgi:GTP cyclohydrolase I